MNVTQEFILDNYKRLKEIQGVVRLDEVKSKASLEGTWNGRQIKITAHFDKLYYSVENVLEEFEYTLNLIERKNTSCYPLLINDLRRIFACARPQENPSPIQPKAQSRKRRETEPDEENSSVAGKRQCVSFSESEDIRFISRKVFLEVKRRYPSSSLKEEFQLYEVENPFKDEIRKQEEMRDTLERLYKEAKEKLAATHEGSPSGDEIAHMMRQLNVQTIQFTEEEYSELSRNLDLDLDKIPNAQTAKFIFKTATKIKKLPDGQYRIIYRLIDRHILDQELPKFLKSLSLNMAELPLEVD